VYKTTETKFCSISLAVITVTLQGFQRNNSVHPVTKGYRQWRFCVPFRIGFKRAVTWIGVIVGLNGEFVHIAQLGANHLSKSSAS